MKRVVQVFSLIAFSLGMVMSADISHAQDVKTNQFYHGTPPEILSPGLTKDSTLICYETFCSNNSGILREPLYSAEYLTEEQIERAKGVSRAEMRFFPDPNLPEIYSSQLSDYSRSNYDRGHMAPWADSADPKCFTLANILPQSPDNNRKLWEAIETATREMAENDGELYVVSGPIFTGSNINMLRGRVAIPDMLFKAIYNPVSNSAGVYIVRNEPGQAWMEISLAELEPLAHIRPFPTLPDQIRNNRGALFLPDYHGHRIPMANNLDTSPVNGYAPKTEAPSYFKKEAQHLIKDFVKGL